ncbi:MAG: HSP90 family protein [Propionibacteriaceae bacterium]|jgi:molecular chaperone HtpG|nr:HSP90 family protein [Propionibacteriaceae bacterium]
MEEVGATFQVDLRGVVDLLARHLYSGPNVYLRELLQNGVDAITARQAVQPDAPATIRVKPFAGDGLEVADTGIGLTPDEARELLATVGRSSKRDIDLGVGRDEFLGQFGIGLLSGFMVADQIELVSCSATDPTAPAVHWTGHDDGRYDLSEHPRHRDQAPGSIVRIRPRRGMEHWLATDTVTMLATDFGSLLPVDIAVEVPLDQQRVWRRVTEQDLPWLRGYPHELARRQTLTEFCEKSMGFTPMAMIDLDVPLAGVSGVAFVLPSAVPPGSGGNHRVYLKRMLLGNRVVGLLPEWAFFVRCVVNATGLSPTASREQLYSDDVLLATQEALADQVRRWVIDTLSSESNLAKQFVRTHHLAVRSLALTDDDMLDLAAQVLPFESTDGARTLREMADEAAGPIVYTSSLEEYRRVAAVARAQGVMLVNAGYVYDGDLLEKLAQRPGWSIRPLLSDDIAQVLSPISPHRELEILDSLAAAAEIAEPLNVEPVVRRFEPEALPAILLGDREGDYRRAVAEAVEEADDAWSGVLASFGHDSAASRQLVLNDANPTIRQWVKLDPSSPVFAAGLHSMYVSAVLLSGESLRAREAELMNESLGVLLAAGLAGPGASAGGQEGPDEPLGC